MPILLINIDDIPYEFKIIPLNIKINNSIVSRYVDKDGFLDRPNYLAHVVKEPKMSKKEWAEIPTTMITKILRNINYYIESIKKKEHSLRVLYTQIKVYEDEMDDILYFLVDNSDDVLWDRVNDIKGIIGGLKEKQVGIENEIEYIKSDKVVFDADNCGYDVQSVVDDG